jgi:hypothetical protein
VVVVVASVVVVVVDVVVAEAVVVVVVAAATATGGSVPSLVTRTAAAATAIADTASGATTDGRHKRVRRAGSATPRCNHKREPTLQSRPRSACRPTRHATALASRGFRTRRRRAACGSGFDQAWTFLLGQEPTALEDASRHQMDRPAASSGSVRKTARRLALPRMNPRVGASRSTRVMSPCREGSTR